MKRTDRPRARRRAGIVLSETHRSGMRALRLSESTDEPIYTYNLHSRTRDPAEVRAASRDEMPELPEYMVSRIRYARDEGAAAHRQDSARGEGTCAGNDDSQTRIPVPADMYAPLPEEEPPSANGKAVRSGSKSAQSRLRASKPAPLPADKEPPCAKTASKASPAKPPRAKPAAKGRKAAALSDDLPDLPDDVFRDMRSARDDIASADESMHLPDSNSVYTVSEPLLSGDCTFELTADEIAAALSGARAEGISADLARGLRFALASPADVDWGELKYDYCEIYALRVLARLILGPKRALIGCLAEVQARRAIAQACALEDVMQAAGDVLSGAAFIKP